MTTTQQARTVRGLSTADIMVDIDDVLFPWADEVHRRSGIAGLHDGSAPWKTWHMWEDYGCSKEAWLDVIADATLDGMYTDTPPYADAAEAIRRLWWNGHKVHMVTARGFMEHADEIRRWTPDWLAEFGIPYDTLHFAKDKVAVQHELAIRYDWAIDDGVHNYEALDAAGVEVYLLTRPHNETFPATRRVATVGEFVDMILEETA